MLVFTNREISAQYPDLGEHMSIMGILLKITVNLMKFTDTFLSMDHGQKP